MKPSLFLYFSLAVCCFPAFAQAESPADMISSYRVQHGEGRVVVDSTLTRIAHEQAEAMAAKDKLDHDVLGGFTSRAEPQRTSPMATTASQRRLASGLIQPGTEVTFSCTGPREWV
jgi:hypothetical protein